MITLIGSSATIIGFGLCGIERVVELDTGTPAEVVQRHVDEADTPIVMIEERLLAGVSTDRIIIPIPDPEREASSDSIDALVERVIGQSKD